MVLLVPFSTRRKLTNMPNSLQLDLKQFDAVIFDMDGTMIDNMNHHRKAWEQFMKKRELPFNEKEFKEKFAGKKNSEIVQGIFGDSVTEDEAQQYADEKEAIYRDLYAPDIKPLEGLSGLLGNLQQAGKKLAVATTAPKENRDFGFAALGIADIFQVIVGTEHVTEGKPNPEIYLKAAKELGIMPSRCLVFEDTPVGIAAGKAAGMTVVGVLTTYTEKDLPQADFVINDFRDVSFY